MEPRTSHNYLTYTQGYIIRYTYLYICITRLSHIIVVGIYPCPISTIHV